MIQKCAGFLMFIVGIIGLKLNHELDILFNMMEHNGAILSTIAFFIGIMAMALAPKRQTFMPMQKAVTPKNVSEDLIAQLNDINHPKKSDQTKKLRSKKQNKIKPSDIKGLIIDK